MRERLIRFMYGRYGVDHFSKFLITCGLIITLCGSFFRIGLLPYLGWILVIYSYYRIFSRNHSRRFAENQAYLKHSAPVRNFISKQRYLFSQRKTHRIFTCPSCHQKIRIPKGKGKIEIRCPKCSKSFIKRS